MYETFSKQDLNSMTSDSYKAAFEGPDGEAFRKRVMELENQPRQATQPAAGTRPANARAATPGETSFDPSFADEEQPAPAAAPVAVEPAPAPAAVVDPAELPERVHEYQPLSRDGKKVGGLQRFKYRTDAELIQKLTAAHMASSARIRELSRDRALEKITAAGSTEKNFTPSTEVPKTMEELAQELIEQRQQNFLLSVREALNTFQLSVDWSKYRTNENAKSVVLAVERAGADPTDPQSYHDAFSRMRDYLEPISQPVAAAPVAATVEPTPAPVAAASAPAAPVVRPSTVTRLGTGFSNADSTSTNDPFEAQPTKVVGVRIIDGGKTTVMTLGEWNKLASDTQKRILRSSQNSAQIEALYEAADAAKAAARSGR